MINRQTLLADLQKLLAQLEADLLERSDSADVPAVGAKLRSEYDRAKSAERTAQNYQDWRSDAITQAAAAWVLSCVFVRFLEDNSLIDPPKLAGPADRLQRARDEHEMYFRQHPRETDREYLLAVFDELAKLPGTKDIFGEHNPIRELPNWLSGDAAGELLRFFQAIDANTGALVRDFIDPAWDTRFLGDLYQDLSEAARKKYALLQTPEFVEEFILDRTLEPALEEFGLTPGMELSVISGQQSAGQELLNADKLKADCFRMIDPACGSGHFLLGTFPRLLARWQKQEPGTNVRVLVQRALDSIHGVDVNPYAIAIARFRLLLAALKECGIRRLADAPAFQLNLACGDSLLHGAPGGDQQLLGFHELAHAYQGEDLPRLRRLLAPGRYHAVVANPPYITVKDRALNQAYRERYPEVCHMKYSLSVPFMQRLVDLAVGGSDQRSAVSSQQDDPAESCSLNADRLKPAGFIGQITANSFMKREFGKKLIEAYLPKWDLTHVIDTSGAYIPGHGTPTVVLFGRSRKPIATTIRTAMGIAGEPATPDDPAQGLVWTAIVNQLDQPGSQSRFISVNDSPRLAFHKHPWSIGGGGASELKELLDDGAPSKLTQVIDRTGIGVVTLEDDAFAYNLKTFRRRGINNDETVGFVEGDTIRDWQISGAISAIFPYIPTTFEPAASSGVQRTLWPVRTGLRNRLWFSKTQDQRRMSWYEYGMLSVPLLRTPLSIVFGEVATHNHFVLDRGGKVFNRTAPVIKLPADATEDDHLALLGLLNSSTACFWMKQVCFPKGTTTGDISKEKGKAESNRFAFNATSIASFPMPAKFDSVRSTIVSVAKGIDNRAQMINRLTSMERLQDSIVAAETKSIKASLEDDALRIEQLKREMCFLQEELDWVVYFAYGLVEIPSDSRLQGKVLEIRPDQRPFVQPLDLETVEPELNKIWKARRTLIESIHAIQIIETPIYKRPWKGRQGIYGSGARTVREAQIGLICRWLLERLESYFDFDGRMSSQQSAVSGQPEGKADSRSPIAESSLTSVAKLADIARQDAEFQQVGQLYRSDPAFDVQALVAELVAAESVPLLPILRYKPSGLRKRAEWEKTWELQRREDELSDRLSAIGGQLEATQDEKLRQRLTIEQDRLTAERCLLTASLAVPPKYTSADFLSTGGARYWALRGKLDVPKERWVSFPHCEGPDGTLMIAWAGYDHLQLARAISEYYVRVQTELGGSEDPRLVPLLAAVVELLPWLKQWHNEPDAAFNGLRMGDYFESFVAEEARTLNKTIDDIKAWQPPARTAQRARRPRARQATGGADDE